MSLKQQHPAENAGQPSRFEGPFIDREEHFSAFVDAIESQSPNEYCVLVNHGIGGIGKQDLLSD